MQLDQIFTAAYTVCVTDETHINMALKLKVRLLGRGRRTLLRQLAVISAAGLYPLLRLRLLHAEC